jgi:hypothetical protein
MEREQIFKMSDYEHLRNNNSRGTAVPQIIKFPVQGIGSLDSDTIMPDYDTIMPDYDTEVLGNLSDTEYLSILEDQVAGGYR